MIVVSDNEGDRVEVGETRAELVQFLQDTCSDDYAEQVLAWFDAGFEAPYQLDQGNEGVIDTWEWLEDYDGEPQAEVVDKEPVPA